VLRGFAEAIPKAIAPAKRAVQLDPQLAEAHTSLGFCQFCHNWDRAGAEREYRRAIELQVAGLRTNSTGCRCQRGRSWPAGSRGLRLSSVRSNAAPSQPNATLVPEETAFQIQLVSFGVGRLRLEDRLVTATGPGRLGEQAMIYFLSITLRSPAPMSHSRRLS
jgi:hypothetical protein